MASLTILDKKFGYILAKVLYNSACLKAILLNPDEEFRLQSPYCPQCYPWSILEKTQRYLKQTFDHLWDELSTSVRIVYVYISFTFLVHYFPTARTVISLQSQPWRATQSPVLHIYQTKLKLNNFKSIRFGKNPQFQRTQQHSVRFAFWICSKIPAVPPASLKRAGFFQHSVQSALVLKTLSGDSFQIKRTSTSGKVSCGM